MNENDKLRYNFNSKYVITKLKKVVQDLFNLYRGAIIRIL